MLLIKALYKGALRSFRRALPTQHATNATSPAPGAVAVLTAGRLAPSHTGKWAGAGVAAKGTRSRGLVCVAGPVPFMAETDAKSSDLRSHV